MCLDVDIGRKLLKCRDGQRQPGDHAGLPRDQHSMGLRFFRNSSDGSDVAGAPEIFVQRALHGFVDGERRQERFGVE